MFLLLSIILSVLLAACGNTANNEKKNTATETVKKDEAIGEESIQLKEAFIYTAEHGAISKVDSATNKKVASMDIEGSVHNVQVSPDGNIIGATVVPESGGHGGHNGGHEENANGFAFFYDTKTDELIKQVEVGSHPAHIVFTENMKYALVTNNEDNNVSVIDMADYQVVQTIPTGKGPHGFRIASDSKTAYIANMGENTVSVIDVENMNEKKKVVVGETPVTTGITSDGKTLVATLNSENVLAVVDLETEKVEKVPVGEGPAQVYIQQDGKYAFVANQGTPETPSDSVSKINLETKEVAATIKVGNGAHGVVTSEDNQFVYITNMYENTVSIIDNSLNKVTSTIKVGDEPNGITFK
jgi:YVTN family beta-propeller protein